MPRAAMGRAQMADTTLTDFERQVMRAIPGGKTYREIAADLGVTPEQVKHAAKRIEFKLNLKNRVLVALIAESAKEAELI